MSMVVMGEQQEKEIETIRERKITVKLSDADCDRLARKCGKHGLAIGELIENFIGDLVCGTYSNGSDERDYAERWFDRCWFGMFPDKTLLNHLLYNGYDPEHYLFALHNIETAKANISNTEKEIAEPSDEWKHLYFNTDDCKRCRFSSVDEYVTYLNECLQSYQDDYTEWTEEMESMREDWKPEKEPDMDEEIELIKEWIKERSDLINE